MASIVSGFSEVLLNPFNSLCPCFALQVLINMGFTKNKNGELSIPRSILAGAVAGGVGASFASPFYMVGGSFVFLSS